MNNGTVPKARPTLYKGIRMRSRLEADYARHLDEGSSGWEYEPECFAGPAGQWLPDFRVDGRTPHYVEVKPAEMLTNMESCDAIDAILAKMEMAWLSKPEAHLSIVFWLYEASFHKATILATGNRRPWFIDDGGICPMLAVWPGMGQVSAVRASRDPAYRSPSQ